MLLEGCGRAVMRESERGLTSFIPHPQKGGRSTGQETWKPGGLCDGQLGRKGPRVQLFQPLSLTLFCHFARRERA